MKRTPATQMTERVNVTKTFLPPIEEYQAYVQQIWDNVWLTNQGPLLLEFEKQAKAFLGVNDFHFLGNGTLSLQLALRALGVTKGEVITTPFSYVATTSSILWEHCTPVFVDIEPDSLTLDPAKIEAAITPKTRAIMPVHVFGHPCDIEAIDTIAKKHDLKVIYDAAHAFGARYQGRSLLDFGDISMGSFHSTKVFHTVEGGCVVPRDKKVSVIVEEMKRFGHTHDDHHILGINAKASEFHAAMGLCNLKYVSSNIAKRKETVELYDKQLGDIFEKPKVTRPYEPNYGYYPIIAKDERQALQIIDKLAQHNIFPRRYFYPSLNKLPYLQTIQRCPISEDISLRILCLPLSHETSPSLVRKICEVISV